MYDTALHKEIIADNRIGLRTMPTLFRLLTTIAILLGLAYGAMFALATLVEPKRTEMRITIPSDRFTEPR